jgi:hypothetical protein
MIWIAPTEKDTANATLEKRFWDPSDQFRANSVLKAQEYSCPILGLIFQRFAEVGFAKQRTKLKQASGSSRGGSRVDEPAAYHAESILDPACSSGGSLPAPRRLRRMRSAISRCAIVLGCVPSARFVANFQHPASDREIKPGHSL